jgi:DNA-binding CsgD family transcriptional regulator
VTARSPAGADQAPAIAVELAIDDPEVAERFRTLILGQPGLRIVDPDDEEGPAPDVRISDGTERGAGGAARIVIADHSGAMTALQSGASAVLSARTSGKALHAAIQAASQGLTTVSPEHLEELVDGMDAGGGLERDAEAEPTHVELTEREQQVLQLLAQGASNKIIARHLGITPHTAKFHVASIATKLGATGRTDTVAKAMRMGLVMI